MTFTRMLDWIGGRPTEATAVFEELIDAQPVPSTAPSAPMTKEDKRAALQAGINARGEAPKALA